MYVNYLTFLSMNDRLEKYTCCNTFYLYTVEIFLSKLDSCSGEYKA